MSLGAYNNEIERFIYEKCYKRIWESVQLFITAHPYQLDLTFSRIKYPESALLEDMILELTKNVRIDEDQLLFDAVVSCTINLTGDTYKGNAYCDISQWFEISCVAIITDKLESFNASSIIVYTGNRQRKEDGQAASKNIVPIIHKVDLEDEATTFLEKYCPEALEKPMAVPIISIAESMGLEIYQGYRITDDFSIFGQICFSDGDAEVYDLFNFIKSTLHVRRGTILIDACTFWERNLGCVNNTIAHEVYHWYKDHITNTLNAIHAVVSAVWNAISGFISGVLNTISSVVSSVWNAIKNTVTTVMNAIKTTVSNIWDSVKNAVTQKITAIKDTIVNGFNAAVNFIKNLASQAFQWGADIINGIVNGIKNCIGKVADAVKGVANKIKSFLHFSVPDEGPLADFESWMPDFMQGLADGTQVRKARRQEASATAAGLYGV